MQPFFLMLLSSYLLLTFATTSTTGSNPDVADNRNNSSNISSSSSTLIDQLLPVLALLSGTPVSFSPSSSSSSTTGTTRSTEQLDNHINIATLNKMQQERRHRRRKNRHHQTLLDRFQFLDNRIESVEQLSASLQQHQLRLLNQLNDTLHLLNQPTRRHTMAITTNTNFSSPDAAAAAGSAAADQLHLLARLQLQLQTLRDLQQLLEMPGNETLLAARPAEYSLQEFGSPSLSQPSPTLLSLTTPAVHQQQKPTPSLPSLQIPDLQSAYNSSATNLTGPWQRSFFRRLSQLALRSLTTSSQMPLNKVVASSAAPAAISTSLQQLLNNKNDQQTTSSETVQETQPAAQMEGEFPTLAAQSKASNCSVRPMLQTLEEPNCEPKVIKINFCYGHCASFFLPGLQEPNSNLSSSFSSSSPNVGDVVDQSLGDPVQPEEVAQPQMRSCPSCLPAQSRWLHVRLNCPFTNPPHKLRRVQLIQKCRCQT